MVPAKVEAADLRPVPRDGNGIDGDALLAHRKDAPGAQRRDAVEPRLALVRPIASPLPRRARRTARAAATADV